MINKIISFFSHIKYFGLADKVIFFCENKVLYEKIIKKEIDILKKHLPLSKIIIISYKYELDFIYETNIKKLNFKSEISLRFFLSNLEKSIIISTTPTINNKLSNGKNKFIYTHHSLGLLTNSYIFNYLKNFDYICVNNKDQFHNLKNILSKNKINSIKILKEKYYDLEHFDNEIKKNNTNKTILIASSFYGNSIIENLDMSLLIKLSDKYNIIYRPHPESRKNLNHLDKLNKLETLSLNNLTISYVNNTRSDILNSDLLITDYSGICLSFAYTKKIKSLNLLKKKEDLKYLTENISQETINKISVINYYNYNTIIDDLDTINLNKENDIQNLVDKQFKEFKKKVNYKDIIKDEF